VVSGVGSVIHVLDGSPRASKGKGLFLAWSLAFCEIFVQYLTMATYGYTDILIDNRLMCENRQYFRTHGIPMNSASNSLSYDIVRFKIKVGVDAKFMRKT